MAMLADLLKNPTADCYDALFHACLDGKLSDIEIGAFLSILAAHGNPPEAILAGMRALRQHMTPLLAEPDLSLARSIDIVGTGGDGHNTLNISTAAALVVAASGVTVLKHGNRAASSTAGAADVLEASGLRLLAPTADATEAAAYFAQAVRGAIDAQFAFMFAPNHHGAMRYVGTARRALGFRTIFNLIGPLANPAGVKRYLLGCGDVATCRTLCSALMHEGAEHVWGVTSAEGMDELGLEGINTVIRAHRAPNGEASFETTTLDPQAYGFAPTPIAAIRGGSLQENANALKAVLCNDTNSPDFRPAYRDAVLLNAAAGICIAEEAPTPTTPLTHAPLAHAIERARSILESAKAWNTLSNVIHAVA